MQACALTYKHKYALTTSSWLIEKYAKKEMIDLYTNWLSSVFLMWLYMYMRCQLLHYMLLDSSSLYMCCKDKCAFLYMCTLKGVLCNNNVVHCTSHNWSFKLDNSRHIGYTSCLKVGQENQLKSLSTATLLPQF